MNQTTRKVLLIMVAIMLAEGIPMAIMLVRSPPGVFWRLYGFDPAISPAWLAGGVVAAGYCFYAARAIPLISERFLDLDGLKLLAVPFALISGTMEEVWFRKQVMNAAAAADLGAAAQVAAAALLFGLVHAVWGVFARKWRVALGSMVATGALGAMLAIVYLWARRDVAPCIWSHTLINLVIEPWLLVAAVSGGMRRPSRPAPNNPHSADIEGRI